MNSPSPQRFESKLYHCAAYYPELWPLNDIDRDIELMQAAGINLIRMGEFAWSAMEPSPGEYHMDLFIHVIDKFFKAGIETVFCTPTATPPVWLTFGHPDRLFVNASGVRMSHGARQHVCTDHPYVRERGCLITEAIAKAIGNHPALVAWQTDNEFKCHLAENFSVSSQQRWHQWLQSKFTSIEALNEAWGTKIWSEEYFSFEQVPLPWPTPCMHNASLESAFKRFSREMISEYQSEQIAVIRKHSNAPITHNSGIRFNTDPEMLFSELDFASFDHYVYDKDWGEMALLNELWRSIKPDRAFWILETGSAHNGSIHGGYRPCRRLFVRAEAVAAFASGARNFGYWVWRQQRTGVEQPHGCIISSWQEPTIGYENVLAVNDARMAIEPIILKTELVRPQFAMTWSDKARTSLETEHFGSLDYVDLMRDWTRVARNSGLYFDLISENLDPTIYKVISTPYMLSVSDQYLEKMVAWVRNGGIWILGPLTGLRTEHHGVPTNAGLGKLEAFAGIKTKFTYPMSDTGAIGHAFGLEASLGLWSCVFEPTSALSLGQITGGQTPGLSFLTENQIGKGKIVILGSLPIGSDGEKMIAAIANHYAKIAQINPFPVSAGTTVTPRTDGTHTYWIIVNMDGAGGTVEIPVVAIDAISGAAINPGIINLSDFEYRIIQFPENLTP